MPLIRKPRRRNAATPTWILRLLHVAELALLVRTSGLSLFHGVLVTTSATVVECLLQIRRAFGIFTFFPHMTIAAWLDRALSLIGMMTGAALHFFYTTDVRKPSVQFVLEGDSPELSREHNDVLINRNLATNCDI